MRIHVFSVLFDVVFSFTLLRPLVWLPEGLKQGTCEEVPEVPSPPGMMEMCLLPGSLGRMLPPSFNAVIVRCKAYEICMPLRPELRPQATLIGPDDTSTGLG